MPDKTQSMAITLVDQKKVDQLEQAGPKLLEEARALKIKNNDDYLAAGGMLEALVDRQKKIVEFFKEPVDQANKLHKFLTSLRSRLASPFQQAEDLVKQRRKDFRDEAELRRQAKEAEERKKAKAEVEAQAVAEAAELHAIGETAAAETIIEKAAMAPAPPIIVQSEIPKEEGKSIRKSWTFRIKDPEAIKREFITPKDLYDIKAYPKIRAMVQKLGPDATSIVGGIEVVPEETEVVRTK